MCYALVLFFFFFDLLLRLRFGLRVANIWRDVSDYYQHH